MSIPPAQPFRDNKRALVPSTSVMPTFSASDHTFPNSSRPRCDCSLELARRALGNLFRQSQEDNHQHRTNSSRKSAKRLHEQVIDSTDLRPISREVWNALYPVLCVFAVAKFIRFSLPYKDQDSVYYHRFQRGSANLHWFLTSPPLEMLTVLLALQYECTAKISGKGVDGKKKTIKQGGDCPDNVACSKMSTDEFKKLPRAEGADEDMSGTVAECIAFLDEESCTELCKVGCIHVEEEKTYKVISEGEEEDIYAPYFYYCPKGEEKYKAGLSGGAIAGIVIACVVVVAAIALCVVFFVCKKRTAKNG